MRILLNLTLLFLTTGLSAQVYSCIDGQVNFISEAPLEIISASSNQLQGALDLENKTFAFKIYIKSFEGFNSPLQQEHFYENYMEVAEYPIATFKGKVLENFKEGQAKYRAKGMLNIHGVEVERIIDVTLSIDGNSVEFYTTCIIPLVDHEINLPRIVYQKIAEEILVSIQGVLNLRK